MNAKTNILYCRLSREDGDTQQESNSIGNQKRMLAEYAERNGFVPYEFAVDDGYSGTNYNRPGWQELIGKVEADEVGVITPSRKRAGQTRSPKSSPVRRLFRRHNQQGTLHQPRHIFK
jgi:DNA invertase Pin-like site-specific DNA recombinase